ncbi:MAG: FAD-dependent oxidoreductase [Desulfovibrio sp.]|nr:FAD-dependent oxidoreductase [Desulfovibrio sp.]
MQYDLVVIGAGPGGYDCAVHAAGLGLRTALVERDALGGTCLNRGCVPTKLMLGATASIEELQAQARIKVARGDIAVDWSALQNRKDKLLAGSRKAMNARLKSLGIDLYDGHARVAGPGRVEVSAETASVVLECTDLVLATGCRPSSFPGLVPDGRAVLDSDAFLDLTTMPESLIVVGGGVIGLEMAQAAHRMGAQIHLFEALERVAATEDPDVSQALQAIFRRRRWNVKTGVKVRSVTTENERAVLVLEDDTQVEAEKALIAVGRRPNTEELGLESLDVKQRGPGWVTVDEHLCAAPHVYAIGDVNGRIQLAHAASDQARYVARLLAGKTQSTYAPGPVPGVIYGSPECLRVGTMVEELEAQGKKYAVTSSAWAINPIAQAHAAPQGFVKVVWHKDRVVGITAVGHDASRFTAAATIMVRDGWTKEQAESLIFAHPTLDEALMHALLDE